MKKLPLQIEQDLKKLQEVGPDHAWKSQNEQSLKSQLNLSSAENISRYIGVRELVSAYLGQWTSQMTWKSVGTFVLLFGIVLGPGIATVSAARGSLPGDKLYTIKRSIEKVKVKLAFTDTKKGGNND